MFEKQQSKRKHTTIMGSRKSSSFTYGQAIKAHTPLNNGIGFF